jgi:hypothetical protein
MFASRFIENTTPGIIVFLAIGCWQVATSPAALADTDGVATRLKEANDALLKDPKTAADKLREAKAMAGQRIGDYAVYWLVLGKFAFYAGDEQANMLLVKSFLLDSKNGETRHYLGRIRAARRFKKGEVSAESGLSEQNPIRIVAVSEEYEFLRLFRCQFTERRTDYAKQLDKMTCRKVDGDEVQYHFDFSEKDRYEKELQEIEKPGSESQTPR